MNTQRSNLLLALVIFVIAFLSLPAAGAAEAAVAVGKKVEFKVTVDGAPPFTYKWFKAAPGTTQFAQITGAALPSYVIPRVTAADSGIYRVEISNAVGKATSDNGTLTVAAPPRVIEFGITVTEADPANPQP